MSRKRSPAPKRKPDRFQRERRRRFIIEVVIAITIIAVAALVTFGLYDSKIKPWHETVVRVNDTAFDMNYFVKLFRLYGGSGQDLEQDIQIAEMAAEVIINNEIKKQGAEARGIFVTSQEVEDKFWEFMGSDPDRDDAEFFENYRAILKKYHVSDEDFRTMVIEPMVIEERLREYMADAVYPEDGKYEHVSIQAALFGMEEDAASARTDWETYGFDYMINATSPSQQHPPKGSTEEWLPRGIEGAEFDAFAFGEGMENPNVISQPVHETEDYTTGGYWLYEVLEKRTAEAEEGEEEELHIQAILVDSKSTAQEVAEKYNGENFAELAAEYSLDSSTKDKGGDMGWVTLESAISKFGAGVETIELNVLSEPYYSTSVSKKSGYWIMNVVAIEERELTESHRTTLTSTLFNSWIEASGDSDENDIENLLDYNKIFWAIGHLDIETET